MEGKGGKTCGIDFERGVVKRQKKYLLYKFLNLISESIFPLRRDGKVEFLLSDGFYIVVQVNKVCGGLKVDFAMVGVHIAFFLMICCKRAYWVSYGVMKGGPFLFTYYYYYYLFFKSPKLKLSIIGQHYY